MKFDDIGFKDEIELMNIERQIKQKQIDENKTFGFNIDNLYEILEKKS